MWADSRKLRRLSLISVNESDMSFQLLYPYMANRAFLLVLLSLVQMNNVYVLPQISGGCKAFVAFLTRMPLAHLVCFDMFGQTASLAEGFVANITAVCFLVLYHGALCRGISKGDVVFFPFCPFYIGHSLQLGSYIQLLRHELQ